MASQDAQPDAASAASNLDTVWADIFATQEAEWQAREGAFFVFIFNYGIGMILCFTLMRNMSMFQNKLLVGFVLHMFF